VLLIYWLKPGNIIPMNYHFTNYRNHILYVVEVEVVELLPPEALECESDFKL